MKYIIEKDRLVELLQAEDLLSKLEALGVDNWSGYGMVDEEEMDIEEQLKDYEKLEG